MTIGLADCCAPDEVSMMRTYVEALRRAGHLPVVLPATGDRAEVVQQLCVVDALLLAGGGDLDARHFGYDPLPTDGEPNPRRDAYELLLLEVALERRTPVLGICRGMQVINVFFGGTLIQDLPTQWCPAPLPGGQEPLPLIEHSRPDKKWEPVHEVCIDSQSWLASVLQAEHAWVNSTHHQAVEQLGRGLRMVAWSPDGVVEGIESLYYPIWGVQFHPERLLEEPFPRIFKDIVPPSSVTARSASDTPSDRHRS